MTHAQTENKEPTRPQTFAEGVKALQRLAASIISPPSVCSLPLRQVQGYRLAHDLVARSDRPKGNISAMDGYLICRADRELLEEQGLPLTSSVYRAGDKPSPHQKGYASSILTGAQLPKEADWVIPVEYVHCRQGRIFLKERPRKSNIRYQGEEIRQGDVLLPAGRRITFKEIAVLAAQGLSTVTVEKPPIMGILSNGWEFNAHAGDHRHDINTPMLRALFASLRVTVREACVTHDNEEMLSETLGKLLKDVDILITTGGISVGKTDYIYQALCRLGARPVFRRLAIKPGRPMTVMSWGKKAIFSLPGNPGASAICARVFIVPFLARLYGYAGAQSGQDTLCGKANFSFEAPVAKNCFLLVKSFKHQGAIWLQRVPTKGASDITSLSQADGIVIIERGCRLGESLDVLRL